MHAGFRCKCRKVGHACFDGAAEPPDWKNWERLMGLALGPGPEPGPLLPLGDGSSKPCSNPLMTQQLACTFYESLACLCCVERHSSLEHAGTLSCVRWMDMPQLAAAATFQKAGQYCTNESGCAQCHLVTQQLKACWRLELCQTNGCPI